MRSAWRLYSGINLGQWIIGAALYPFVFRGWMAAFCVALVTIAFGMLASKSLWSERGAAFFSATLAAFAVSALMKGWTDVSDALGMPATIGTEGFGYFLSGAALLVVSVIVAVLAAMHASNRDRHADTLGLNVLIRLPLGFALLFGGVALAVAHLSGDHRFIT